MAAQTIADTNGRREFPVEAGQLGEWYFRSETAEHYNRRGDQMDEFLADTPPQIRRRSTYQSWCSTGSPILRSLSPRDRSSRRASRTRGSYR